MNDTEATHLALEGTDQVIDIAKVLELVDDDEELLNKLMLSWGKPERLYTPSKALVERIDDYITWCYSHVNEDPGKLMEEIACLAFISLKGFNSVRGYQSFAPQIDLSITGSGSYWKALMSLLRIDWRKRTIIVESKNEKSKVDIEQFSRLCSIMQNMFDDTCDLGVFFTKSGATGFPDPDDKRKRALGNSQAMQIIFHAKTRKYVIVIDHNDILLLKEPGSLPIILERKIRSVEDWNGLAQNFKDTKLSEVDLPPYLDKHIPDTL